MSGSEKSNRPVVAGGEVTRTRSCQPRALINSPSDEKITNRCKKERGGQDPGDVQEVAIRLLLMVVKSRRLIGGFSRTGLVQYDLFPPLLYWVYTRAPTCFPIPWLTRCTLVCDTELSGNTT